MMRFAQKCAEDKQRENNYLKKAQNKNNIDAEKNSIMLANATSREFLK